MGDSELETIQDRSHWSIDDVGIAATFLQGDTMIESFKLLRNLGQFENGVQAGPIPLGRLTLCHAGNGRGKTTLATVLRSLANNDPELLHQRRRVNSVDKPQVVIQTNSPSGTVHFTDGKWNGKHPNIVVFDDEFVNQNVCSGLSVSPQQRQNLHDVILGHEAVALKRRLVEQVDKIENYNGELRSIGSQIRARIPGNLTADEICKLPEDPQIAKKIESAEKLLHAASDRQRILSARPLEPLSLPHFDLVRVEQVLQMGLDAIETEALKRVHDHIAHLGDRSEEWLSDGMRYVKGGVGSGPESSTLCPYCGQKLNDSQLIETYQTYFGDEYIKLKRLIQELYDQIVESFGDGLRARFEQELRVSNESRQYWREYVDAELLCLATDEIFEDCTLARDGVLKLIEAKVRAPIERLCISDELQDLVVHYNNHVSKLQQLMKTVDVTNRRIDDFKAQLEASDVDELKNRLSKLQAKKIRHSPDVAKLCDEYLVAKAQKVSAEERRDATRLALDEYRRNTFDRSQDTVNQCLATFGAHFKLGGLKPLNIRSGSTTTYGAVINTTSVGVFGSRSGESEPSFRTVFSAGDRATLALAFFLASIDQMGETKDLTVVLDDPITSMDDGRTLATAQTIRHLASRAAQVIVFSHDKGFLCRIWEGGGDLNIASTQILRRGNSSILECWDVKAEFLTEHDKRNTKFKEYLYSGRGNEREIAKEIRRHLESYLRVSCADIFPPNTPLGRQFISNCKSRLGKPDEVLTEGKLVELCNILEYANGFHHDTNPAWESQAISPDELRAYVERTVRFVRPR